MKYEDHPNVVPSIMSYVKLGVKLQKWQIEFINKHMSEIPLGELMDISRYMVEKK